MTADEVNQKPFEPYYFNVRESFDGFFGHLNALFQSKERMFSFAFRHCNNELRKNPAGPTNQV